MALEPRSLREKIVAAILFFLTALSTTFAGALLAGVDPLATPGGFFKGLPYSLTLLLILSAHEAGHFLMARRYGVNSPLPWFIPAPTLVGTFGALIRLPRLPGSRVALFDIALAGPVAGLVPSILALIVGIRISSVMGGSPGDGKGLILGESLLFKGIEALFGGENGPGQTLFLSPVGFAGWVGLLVTALNMLPVGQLDGGHISYALFGRRARFVSWGLVLAMGILGFLGWRGWWIFGGLVLLFGPVHPDLADVDGEREDLPLSRRVWGGVAALILVLVFVPDPLRPAG